MPYSVKNDTAYINGQSGAYDEKVKDKNVRYGRNAIANYLQYLQGFKLPEGIKTLSDLAKLSKDDFVKSNTADERLKEIEINLNNLSEQSGKIPPIKFKLKYLPEDKVDTKNLNKSALLGAAYEDLGKKESVSIAEFDKDLPETIKKKASAKAFDVNNDGQIDIAEDAAAILIKDMADKIPTKEILETGKIELQADKLDGTITQTGDTNLWALLSTRNVDNSKQLISEVHQKYQLAKAKDEFLNNPNNTVQ